jgi:hypothetical protein
MILKSGARRDDAMAHHRKTEPALSFQGCSTMAVRASFGIFKARIVLA